MLESVAGLGREKDLSLFPISAAGWTEFHSFICPTKKFKVPTMRECWGENNEE